MSANGKRRAQNLPIVEPPSYNLLIMTTATRSKNKKYSTDVGMADLTQSFSKHRGSGERLMAENSERSLFDRQCRSSSKRILFGTFSINDYDDGEDFYIVSNADDGDANANANDDGGFDDGAGYLEHLSILRRYPVYRAYLVSYLCQYLGDWFAKIASILIVEELVASASGDATATGGALSFITLARLIPNALFAPVGGILADRLDRRKLIVIINVLSGITALGFPVALRYKSLELFYVMTSLQSALTATCYPAMTGIVPLLVVDHNEPGKTRVDSHNIANNPRDLQLALTINTWVYGWSYTVAGLLAGTIASVFGLEGCYFIDFAVYWTSAAVIATCIRGDFRVCDENYYDHYRESSSNCVHPPFISSKNININIFRTAYREVHDLFVYLSACGFGMLVFLKASASFVWGVEDIVGAQFSTVFQDDGVEDEELSSVHMGMLSSTLGLGCMTGAMVLNLVTDTGKPYTLQRACLIGILLMTIGWLAISFVQTFPQFLLGSFFRTMGAGAILVNSALILQTLSHPQILGRVLAAEYTFTTLSEAASCAFLGRLSVAGFSKNMLAFFGASLGVLMLLLWGFYHSVSLGAAHPRFNNYYRFL
mmetsp:Transcript_25211/g.55286  ORF Transcript_25211/g.55286 Transcript_25211/m.55286 type:complete len:599 (-) Transcript_25211:155-1951(-)